MSGDIPKVPGTPSSIEPSVDEPTVPVDPPEAKPDQSEPAGVTATGVPVDAARKRAQQSRFLTTAQAPVSPIRTIHSRQASVAPPCCKTIISVRRSRTSITSESPSASCMRAVLQRTECSAGTAPRRASPVPGSSPRAWRPRFSCASRRCSVRVAPPTRCATLADSRPSSTPTKVFSILWETTSRCSSSKMPSSFPTSFMRVSLIPIGDPSGPERPRHILGFRHTPYRSGRAHDVEHVRPGYTAVVPHDGGLRDPHVPPHQRRR